jgi:hypothetical protein
MKNNSEARKYKTLKKNCFNLNFDFKVEAPSLNMTGD